jgi:hypothetical protein
VAVTACVLTLFCLLTSYVRVLRALRWWYQRRSVQLYDQAERIRNDLLQQSFSLRRDLELSIANSTCGSEQIYHEYLTRLEKLTRSLEQLGDQFYPPYTEDSLPLAVQFALEQWLAHKPGLTIDMDLPTHWQHHSSEQTQVILLVLHELLNLTLTELQGEADLQVCLKQQSNIATLTLQITCPNPSQRLPQSSFAELEYLSQSFQFLTQGKCHYWRKGSTTAWVFRWRSFKKGTTLHELNSMQVN